MVAAAELGAHEFGLAMHPPALQEVRLRSMVEEIDAIVFVSTSSNFRVGKVLIEAEPMLTTSRLPLALLLCAAVRDHGRCLDASCASMFC